MIADAVAVEWPRCPPLILAPDHRRPDRAFGGVVVTGQVLFPKKRRQGAGVLFDASRQPVHVPVVPDGLTRLIQPILQPADAAGVRGVV